MNRQQVFEAGTKYITLHDFINKTVLIPRESDPRRCDRVDLEATLTEEDIAAIVEKVGKKCSQSIKDRLADRLSDLSSLYCVNSFTRLEVSADGHWMYNAGQSYPHEIVLLRKALLR